MCPFCPQLVVGIRLFHHHGEEAVSEPFSDLLGNGTVSQDPAEDCKKSFPAMFCEVYVGYLAVPRNCWSDSITANLRACRSWSAPVKGLSDCVRSPGRPSRFDRPSPRSLSAVGFLGCSARSGSAAPSVSVTEKAFGPGGIGRARRKLPGPLSRFREGGSGRLPVASAERATFSALFRKIRGGIARGSAGRGVVIWLILPVVICLSQRLSHACASTYFNTVKPRMAH